ncbi:MAG: PH domain-containing protein [Pseudonocardiales bacterium]
MHFRSSGAERAAAVVWLAASSALATARWWLLPALLLPLAWVAAAFRRGTDVDDDGVRVRGLLGSRHLAWDRITELRPAGRRVVAVTRDGHVLGLPTVSRADLKKLPR